MNAAEHKARAKELLAKVETPKVGTPVASLAVVAQVATVHAILATIPDPVTFKQSSKAESLNSIRSESGLPPEPAGPKVGDELTEEPDPSVVLKFRDKAGDNWTPHESGGGWSLNYHRGGLAWKFDVIINDYGPLHVAEVAE